MSCTAILAIPETKIEGVEEHSEIEQGKSHKCFCLDSGVL